MYWLIFCTIFILFCLSVRLKHYHRKYKLISSIVSSEKNWPVIGVAHMFIGNTESIMKSLHEFGYEASEKGGIMSAWLGPSPYVVLTDGSIIDTILKHHLEKDDMYRILRTATGNGLLFAPEKVWKGRRKIMTSVLNPKVVTSFFDAFLKQSLLLTEKLGSETKQFSIWPYLNSYSFNTILNIALGKESFSMNEDKNNFLYSVTILKNCLAIRCFHFWLHLNLLFRFHRYYSIFNTHINVVNTFLDQAIKKKKQEITSYNEPYTGGSLMKQETRVTFFDLLWYFSKREVEYNDLELREELLTLLIAATDTTASTIGFILKLLAKYPLVQNKVYDELCAAFQDQNMLPNSKEDLSKLEYTGRVICETLRLYPPAPIILSKTNKEITLDNGVVLPENCGVMVSIWALHRNKKYWGEDAEAFDPDRFLPERYSRVPPGSFIPFSSGPRNCPGYGYAMMSMKTTLSAILKTYRIVSEPENGPIPQMKLKFDVTLTPVDDTIALEKRF